MVGAAPESTPYDVVLYPSGAQLRLHPERTATIARLAGFESADVQHCRVLELGCGTGVNLLGMAVTLPHSHFVGVDLSSRAISEGRELLAEASLANVELIQGDVAALDGKLGSFDYVIAHGLYS